jgi:hypothetical protein
LSGSEDRSELGISENNIHLGWHFALRHAMPWEVLSSPFGAIDCSCEIIGLVERLELDLLDAIDNGIVLELIVCGHAVEMHHDEEGKKAKKL